VSPAIGSDLRALLLEARSLGFLGGQSIERQLEHARGFVEVCTAALQAHVPAALDARSLPSDAIVRLLDLGTGGGLPGLVLASSPWPFVVHTVLLDGSVRRAEWLVHAVDELGLSATVEIIGERAEVAGRDPSLRHQHVMVVARSFGRPAVTAECAAPFLTVGGVLVVSEPPPSEHRSTPGQAGLDASDLDARDLARRWPPAELQELGFATAAERRGGGFRYAVLSAVSSCPERYPRRTGIPTKRPLF
jgi:16S rRNA (guanine527-N7)-methyltransferase